MPEAVNHYGAMFASRSNDYDLQRAYHFYLNFNNSGLPDIFDSNVANTLEVAVQNFNLPSISNQQIEYYYGNTKIKLAGQMDIQTGDMTVVDFVGKDVENMLLKWYGKVYDLDTEKASLTTAYKANLQLVQYSPDGKQERVWQLEGCWPTSIQLGSFEYTQNDKKSITMTISVDLAYRLGSDPQEAKAKLNTFNNNPEL